MAAAGHAYAETTADVLATDTTWVDVASIAASSFEANKKYLIIASATLKIASAADRAQARLVRGTVPTVFDDGTLSGEMLNLTQEHQYNWMHVYTQPGTAELVKIQVASETTSDVTCTASQIFVLKLSDDFVENTDYFFTEDLVDYTGTVTMTAKAAVTFTPDGTDRWLVIGHACWAVNALTGEIRVDLYDGTTSHQQNEQEGEDVNDQHAVSLFYCGVPTSGSKTFSVRLANEVASEAVFVSNRVIAINLAKFAASASEMTAAEVQLATRPTWTNLGTLTCVPTVTGNWFYFGSVVNDVNATGTVNYRLQDNEGGSLASDPAYGDTAPQDDQWDPTDEIIYTIFKMKSFSASRTVNYDGSNSAATTGRAQQRILGGFSLELASAGTAYTITPAGTVTPAGAVARLAAKLAGGTSTPAGALVRASAKALAGSASPAGALTRATAKALAGSITAAGSLALAEIKAILVGGSLTPAGALLRATSKVYASTSSPAGAVSKALERTRGGTVAPAGAAPRTLARTRSGTVTPSGALARSTAKALAGAAAPAGSLRRATARVLAGLVSAAGALLADHFTVQIPHGRYDPPSPGGGAGARRAAAGGYDPPSPSGGAS